MPTRKTLEEIFEVLSDSIYDAYIEEFEYQQDEGIIGLLGTIYYSEAIDRWVDDYLPQLMDEYAVRFFDGGGFANAYEGANITIEGYNFSLKSVFDKVKHRG